jgi:hypothetical protein
MTDLKDFLSRWSRRKRGATGDAPPQASPVRSTHPCEEGLAPGVAKDGIAVAERATRLPNPPLQGGREQAESADGASAQLPPSTDLAFDLTHLPSIESITAESDVSAFLAPGVPAELTRAALRRAWAVDPKIRDFVGLAENAWDFNTPGAIPGFGALEMTDELRRHIAQLVNRDLREPSSPEPAESSTAEAQEYRAPADVSPLAPSAAIAPARADLQPAAQAERSPPASLTANVANSGEPDQRASQGARRLHGRALPE